MYQGHGSQTARQSGATLTTLCTDQRQITQLMNYFGLGILAKNPTYKRNLESNTA